MQGPMSRRLSVWFQVFSECEKKYRSSQSGSTPIWSLQGPTQPRPAVRKGQPVVLGQEAAQGEMGAHGV
eukprot:757745-Hanusia_phi.AAC.1